MSENPNSGIAGFQWKPFFKTIDHRNSLKALEAISIHKDPSIRVIQLYRNPIDRYISNARHRLKLPDHCIIGDDECVKNHMMHSKNITIPIGHKLIQIITADMRNRDYVRKKMDSAGVQYLPVSYEELFYTDSANEWMKIFQFLGVGPRVNLTIDRVRENFSMAPTSSYEQRKSISNYRAVEEFLNGTEYYDLLH